MQPHSVIQKQVPRCYPTQRPKQGTYTMHSCLGLSPPIPMGEQDAMDPSDC